MMTKVEYITIKPEQYLKQQELINELMRECKRLERELADANKTCRVLSMRLAQIEPWVCAGGGGHPSEDHVHRRSVGGD